jgi:ATP-dependent Clp protease ATP-binding subunit ClpC
MVLGYNTSATPKAGHPAETRAAVSIDPFGGFGRDFDDLFAPFFGEDPFGGRRPPVQRVDIWRLLDDQARELLSRAAQAAADWGSPDLDVEHLLWAATQLPATRRVLERAGVPVDALAEEMEQAVEHGEPRESAPPLTPAAKRALQDAHRQAQAAGSPGIGAEHVPLGLGANPESRAAQALARRCPTRTSCRAVAVAGSSGERAARRRWTSTAGT